MQVRDLLNKLHYEPFQPFRARLTDNTTMDVWNPNTMVVGPNSAVMPIDALRYSSGYYALNRWRTVALAHIIEFVDIDPPKPQSKPRRAS